MRVDVIVVGQGLAGTQVALALLEKGARVLVVDPGHIGAASKVAAGVLNPVTGQRLVLSWKAGAHVPFAKGTYHKLERMFGATFLREIPIRRLIRSEAERARWEQRRNDPAYDGFLGPYDPPGSAPALRDNPLGSCRILGGAVLDTKKFLAAARQWLLKQGVLEEAVLDPETVGLRDGGVVWRQTRAEKIVFCQGWRGRDNPWFRHLPFQWAKGEIIHVLKSGHGLTEVVNREKWIVPETRETLRIGSTFQWEILDEATTTMAAEALVKAARGMLNQGTHLEIIGHEAGVRPCSHDTKPYLGPSPKDQRVWIANGFGAKGALTTPLCAQELSAAMLGSGRLDPEADVARVLAS